MIDQTFALNNHSIDQRLYCGSIG